MFRPFRRGKEAALRDRVRELEAEVAALRRVKSDYDHLVSLLRMRAGRQRAAKVEEATSR